MTVDLCLSACQTAGYPLAGVEYSGECCKLLLISSVVITRPEINLFSLFSFLRLSELFLQLNLDPMHLT
jgi:hypothetical protein